MFSASIHFMVPRVGRIPSMSPEYTRISRFCCSSFLHVGSMLVSRSDLQTAPADKIIYCKHAPSCTDLFWGGKALKVQTGLLRWMYT